MIRLPLARDDRGAEGSCGAECQRRYVAVHSRHSLQRRARVLCAIQHHRPERESKAKGCCLLATYPLTEPAHTMRGQEMLFGAEHEYAQTQIGGGEHLDE